MKKMMLLFFTALLFYSGITASAAPSFSQLEAYQKKQSICIKGELKDGILNKIACYVKKVSVSNDQEIVDDTLVALKEFSIDDGAFEKVVYLPDSLTDGKYRVFVGTVGSEKYSSVDVDFVSKDNRNSILGKVINGDYGNTYETLTDFIIGNKDIFIAMNCDVQAMENIGDLQTPAEEYIKNGLEGIFEQPYTEGTFDTVYNYCIAFTKVVHGNKPTSALSDNKEVFDIENDIVVSDYIDNCLKQVTPKMGITGIKNIYEDAAMVDEFRNLIDYKETYSLLQKYGERLNISFNAYNDLSNTGKINVQKGMVGVLFSDKDDVKSKFDNLVTENRNTTDLPIFGSGSGSGSGGSGNKNVSLGGAVLMTPNDNKSELTVTFADLNNTEWARAAIETLAKKKIISGVGDNRFEPNRTVKREEFIKMLMGAFSMVDTDVKCDFTDVSKDGWYYPYIASAFNSGIVNGISDTLFGTGENITRQDMAVMIYRTAIKCGIDFSTESSVVFDDEAEFSDYAIEAINALASEKIINGKDNNKFSPSDFATRAEAAKIIFEILQKEGE